MRITVPFCLRPNLSVLGLRLLQQFQKRRYGHDANSFVVADRHHMAKIPADDEITLSSHRAFQYPVIGRVSLDDIERLLWAYVPCDAHYFLFHVTQRFRRILKFFPQHPQHFLLDSVGDVQTENPCARQIKKIPGRAAELKTGNVDVGICGNAEQLLTPVFGVQTFPLFIAKFVNNMVYVCFLDAELASLSLAISV